MWGISENQSKRFKKKYVIFFDGHNTKGLGHKKGRDVGHLSDQAATTAVGLF